jgi:serine/threonine-protein kinase
MNTMFPTLSNTTYHIEAELGSGGGGVVYKAWHERLEKHVVLKRIKEDSGLKESQFRIEVDILKNLKHSHLPQLYDFLTDAGGIYTVMEFIPGQSFSELLKQGQKFTQKQVVAWAEQLSSALAYLHKQKPPVLHSDIKPANIMLNTDGDVCLIDFNISLVLDGNGADMIGLSHGYASPEQYGPQALPSYTSKDVLTDFDVDPGATILDSATTELESGSAPPSSEQRKRKIRMDTRSDIYSFGATLYHLLTGEKPAISTGKIKSLREFGARYSEGIVYVIERCMERDPDKRFQSAAELYEAVANIHKHDTRWKVSQSKKIAAAIISPIAFALFAATALFGNSIMAQEKEERFYAVVYDIENGTDPYGSFEEALSMFWDRIDPYRAMAERLWHDGDLDSCRGFIEANLGNIAQFQSSPEAARSFGDIYFILGNTYYYQSGEPDYYMAKGNFEIAVQFVTDNPVYYRDYAISLARTGNIEDAERVLETARALNLDDDSLNLLSGEIRFAKRSYENAIQHFNQVIESSSDDYLRYRAYHTSDEIFKLLGQPERSAELLSGALNRIPLNRVPEMTERLADAYVRSGDYDNAILLFEHLSQSGAPQFHLLNGFAILLHNAGELDRASTVLIQMSDLFPNDYRVPMRQAFLEADRQSRIENESRDYEQAKYFYDSATKLYNENIRPGDADPEMQQLDMLIEQLRVNKWID